MRLIINRLCVFSAICRYCTKKSFLKKIISVMFFFIFMKNITCQSVANMDSIPNCVLLEAIFTNKIFYQYPSINLNYADTITIFDKSNYFENCANNKVNNKLLLIKNSDILPYPLIGAWNMFPEYRQKYKWYFIIEKPEVIGKIVIVRFIKILSNHSGFLIFLRTGNKLDLIDSKIGQF